MHGQQNIKKKKVQRQLRFSLDVNENEAGVNLPTELSC